MKPERVGLTAPIQPSGRLEHFIFLDASYVGIVLGRQLRNLRRIEHETGTLIMHVGFGNRDELTHNKGALLAYEEAEARRNNNNNNNEDAEDGSTVHPDRTGDERINFLRVHSQTAEQFLLVELAVEAIVTNARKRRVDAVRVPAEALGMIIGKGGAHIKKLGWVNRVRVTISQEGGDYEMVQLEGTQEGINGAKERILEIVDKTTGNTRPGEDDDECEVEVDEQLRQMRELKKQLEEQSEMW